MSRQNLIIAGLCFGSLILTGACSRGQTSGPPVDVPKAVNSQTDGKMFDANSAVISIPQEGEVYLGNAVVQAGDLTTRISAVLNTRPPEDKIVYIRCGRTVKFGTVVDVLDKVRAAGINYVAFVADNKRRLPPTVLEVTILQKLTEAEMKAPISPPPLRSELAMVESNTPQETPKLNIPPPPVKGASPKKYVDVKTVSNRLEAWERLVVEMTKEGNGAEQPVLLNGQPLPLLELESKIFQSLQSSWYPVFVRAPKEKAYEDFISAIDRIAGAGPRQIIVHIDYLDRHGENLLWQPLPTGGPELIGGIPGSIPGVDTNAPPPPSPEATKPAAPKTIRMGGAPLLANVIKRVDPQYPPAAKAAHVTGSVIVEVTIDEAGTVVSARALNGHPLLVNSALEAARGWRFKPTMLSGNPVKVIGTITFNFQM